MSVNIQVDKKDGAIHCHLSTDDGVVRTVASYYMSSIIDEIECFLAGEFPPDLGIRVSDGLSSGDIVR